jgi:quinohemoprotein ethanol dehydrogenase
MVGRFASAAVIRWMFTCALGGPALLAATLGLAAPVADEWPVNGGTDLEQHYSKLDDVNEHNVSRLGLAWSYVLDTRRGQEATPIVLDGTMYISTAWSKVVALKAATGEVLWKFDPQVPGEKGVHACCDVVNRGVALAQGSVFVATIDGRLIALDAATGRTRWSVRTFDPKDPYTSTGAPRVVKDTVVIGNGGSELGVRGYVSAYKISDGRLAWRFYTVPGDPAKGPDEAASDEVLAKVARSTWDGDWWHVGGGGTVWDAIVFDRKYNHVYLGVGNGSPWNQRARSNGHGDNLFLSSVVALDADTGKYAWHYQMTPGDVWDYDATQPITLASLKIDGRQRDVLMQASKNGFFYVIDRADGKLLSATAYVPMNWASGVDLKTGRPVEVANARYTTAPFTIYPSGLGGHSWQPMAFSPQTGLLYIPAIQTNITYADDPDFKYRPGRWNTATAFGAPPAGATAINGMVPPGATPTPQGDLLAWDPVAKRPVWNVHYPRMWNGGVLATAGNLVFQGTIDGQFAAYRATDGKALWSAAAGAAPMAGPVAYKVDGAEYVAVLAGVGGAVPVSQHIGTVTRTVPAGRMLVYKLDGSGVLPPDDSVPLAAPAVTTQTFSAAQVKQGAVNYGRFCAVCHGGYILPDLRRSGALTNAAAFQVIVLGGALQTQGMASFRDYLQPDEAESIRAYLQGEAHALAAAH